MFYLDVHNMYNVQRDEAKMPIYRHSHSHLTFCVCKQLLLTFPFDQMNIIIDDDNNQRKCNKQM